MVTITLTPDQIVTYFALTILLFIGLIVYVNLMNKINKKEDIYPYIYGVIISIMTLYIIGLLIFVIYILTRGTLT